jgi:hypothetical protein
MTRKKLLDTEGTIQPGWSRLVAAQLPLSGASTEGRYSQPMRGLPSFSAQQRTQPPRRVQSFANRRRNK